MRKLMLGIAVGAALAYAATATAARNDLGQSFGKGLSAQMSGTVEVPPGDPDGTGTALIRLNAAEGLVCFKLTVANVDPLVAAHIHRGAAGVTGPVVVSLVPPARDTGVSKGCVSADPALISEIQSNPAGFYVNVHNAAYPAGAVRGQLAALQEAAPKPRVITKTKIVHVRDCKKGKHR